MVRFIPASRSASHHWLSTAEPPAAAAWAPLGSLEFFEVLNRWLRAQPPRPEDAALLGELRGWLMH